MGRHIRIELKMGVELIYFDIHGRASCTRIMFDIAGIQWKDTRVPIKDWPEENGIRKEMQEIALGQVPILKVDGVLYLHQQAIEEYAAIKAGMVPTDPKEVMRVKMITETIKEVMQGAFKGGVAVVVSKIGGMFRIGWPTMIGLKGNLRQDQLEERGKIWVGFMIKSFENQIGKIEKILNLNGPIKEGDYALGKQLTLADMYIMYLKLFLVDKILNKYGNIEAVLENAPTIRQLAATIEKHPNVEKYLETNKDLPWTGLDVGF